jgi:hypothetical protein
MAVNHLKSWYASDNLNSEQSKIWPYRVFNDNWRRRFTEVYELTGLQVDIYYYAQEQFFAKNKLFKYDLPRLAKESGCPKYEIMRAVNELAEIGLIDIIKDDKGAKHLFARPVMGVCESEL